MTRKVAVLSHVVLDEVYEPSGGRSHEEVGGAGAYAAVGASLVSEPTASLLVAGTGSAELAMLSAWCRDQGDRSGRAVRRRRERASHPASSTSPMASGKRLPSYGLAHFDAHTPLPEHVPPAVVEQLGAMYLFHADEAPYWERVAAFRKQSSVPILWELSAEAVDVEVVMERAALVDVVSLNRTEASQAGVDPSMRPPRLPVISLRSSCCDSAPKDRSCSTKAVSIQLRGGADRGRRSDRWREQLLRCLHRRVPGDRGSTPCGSAGRGGRRGGRRDPRSSARRRRRTSCGQQAADTLKGTR